MPRTRPISNIPAMRIIDARRGERNDLRLRHIADDLIETQLRLYRQDGQYHNEYSAAIDLIQSAACAATVDDLDRIKSDLLEAAVAAASLDLAGDMYRLVADLGMGCHAHGAEYWEEEATGGMHFSGGDVWDDISESVRYCRYCGCEIITIAPAMSAAEFDALCAGMI